MGYDSSCAIAGCAIAKVPEPIRDGAGGAVAEGDLKRFRTIGRATAKIGYGRNRRDPSERICSATTIACGEDHDITKATCFQRTELQHKIGRAKSRNTEGCARVDTERPTQDRGCPVHDRSAPQI